MSKGKYVEREEIREQAAKALHQGRVKTYFAFTAEQGKFSWTENEAAAKDRKADAGKYGLLTTSELKAEDVIAAYRTLLVAEDVFLVLKDNNNFTFRTVEPGLMTRQCCVHIPIGRLALLSPINALRNWRLPRGLQGCRKWNGSKYGV